MIDGIEDSSGWYVTSRIDGSISAPSLAGSHALGSGATSRRNTTYSQGASRSNVVGSVNTGLETGNRPYEPAR